ncbi:MAG TPA: hypothetical protein PKZ97_15320 [Azospirillaceae bacterium]|nr:hypothetical protein [Azospirillaceae bacterium]HRQ82481.1 hypothetical protein [Azospirillaceae bacterium]
MFAVDDFAVWFAWYFAGNLATHHPAAQRMAADARAAVVGEPLQTPLAEDPNGILDWLTDHSAPPPSFSPPGFSPHGVSPTRSPPASTASPITAAPSATQP